MDRRRRRLLLLAGVATAAGATAYLLWRHVTATQLAEGAKNGEGGHDSDGGTVEGAGEKRKGKVGKKKTKVGWRVSAQYELLCLGVSVLHVCQYVTKHTVCTHACMYVFVHVCIFLCLYIPVASHQCDLDHCHLPWVCVTSRNFSNALLF